MNFKYFMPTEVYFGEDVVRNNKEVLVPLGKKALVVTGRTSAKNNGSYHDIAAALGDLAVDFILFDEVEENPSLETIEKGSRLGKENHVDFVIGIGGGSPMDAGKAMAVLIKNPELDQETIFSGEKFDHLPFVAVATTSGTGSEVTQYSIVTSDKEKIKKNLGQSVFPRVAFVDPKYTYDLPYAITVNTSIDAFTHLVEGYLNTNATVMSDIYGEKGFALFKDCFKGLLNYELDREFRKKVMLASVMGGIQIALNGTSIPHGMGYALTYFKGLPHGLSSGVFTIEFLRSFKNKDKLNRMLDIMEFSSLDELEEVFEKLIHLDLDITEEEIKDYARTFVSNKEKLKNYPEEISFEQILAIYTKSLLK